MEQPLEMVETPSNTELSVGMKLRGKVANLEIYGAVVDIGIGQDALLHISQISPPVNHVAKAYEIGQELDVYILKIHEETGRVALTTQKPPTLSWDELTVGMKLSGTVTRIERFGAFIDVGGERAGMVHVSEITDGYIDSPNEVLNLGQEVEVWVIKFDRRKRQIDLTMKEPQEQLAMDEASEEELPTAMEIAFQRALKTGQKLSPNHQRKGKSRNHSQIQEDILSRTLRDHSTDDGSDGSR
ncbi:MAG: S1 RNA-binding domain-containing protein [Chloroflexi bacterium]|nr:S1 RNA-binding domain-containing protein [Chloroflexota bacterium]